MAGDRSVKNTKTIRNRYLEIAKNNKVIVEYESDVAEEQDEQRWQECWERVNYQP